MPSSRLSASSMPPAAASAQLSMRGAAARCDGGGAGKMAASGEVRGDGWAGRWALLGAAGCS